MVRTLFCQRLCRELKLRQTRNSRYSIRAFAAFLRTDHSTLSQIMRGARRVPTNRIGAWGKKLGMGEEEITFYAAAESAPDADEHARHEQLRHWTTEALSIVREPIHFQILELSRSPNFRADCRWIAAQLNVSVDGVNIAFSRLLRLRLIAANSRNTWTDLTGISELTERQFLGMALARVRERAFGFGAQDFVK
jgi:transcriptional regulator with XRE-family HTH domain